MQKSLIEWGGWYGTIAIITAFALSSFSVIKPSDLLYQMLNLTGAVGIALVSFHKRAYQPGILNIIWAIIALVAIAKILNV